MSLPGAEAAFSGGLARSELIYRRALRHSRAVRMLRVSLVLGITALLLGLVGLNYLPLGGLRLPVELGKLVIRGTKITMQQPHLTGFTSDSRAYQFSADSAAQDITKPDFVELQKLNAKMDMADKSTVYLWADRGLYNMKTDMLTLDDNIRLVSSTGYEARLSHALIDVNKGNVVSEKPVWVKLLDGFLDAGRLHITDKGEVLEFSDVTMTLQSRPPGAKAARP
jgi:lipopolysaccharide export system protein LptC